MKPKQQPSYIQREISTVVKSRKPNHKNTHLPERWTKTPQRLFGTSITAYKSRKKRLCKPIDFPPDGKGIWKIETSGHYAIALMKNSNP